ncbi:hypothetical protein K3495_g1186 [Podosphaera aphanis]|nr:hypothetical protein K3495_g1186 [Podosphaera aphanis]
MKVKRTPTPPSKIDPSNAAQTLASDDSSIDKLQSKSGNQSALRQIDSSNSNATGYPITENYSINTLQPKSAGHIAARQYHSTLFNAAGYFPIKYETSLNTKYSKSIGQTALRHVELSRYYATGTSIPDNPSTNVKQSESVDHNTSSETTSSKSSMNVKQSKSVDQTTSSKGDPGRYNAAGYLILDSPSVNTLQEKVADAGQQDSSIKIYLEKFVSPTKEKAFLSYKKRQLMSLDDEITENQEGSPELVEPFRAYNPQLDPAETEKKIHDLFDGIPSETDVNREIQRKLQSQSIHILGMGPEGQYIAHCISRLPHAPPVILLMHRPLMMQQWHDEGAAIKIFYEDKIFTQSGFHIESSANFRRTSPDQRFAGFGENLEHTSEPPDYIIDTLIITTESSVTIAALDAIKHRIRSTTTICIIQDGLGIVQKINRIIFTDQFQRPTYVLGFLKVKLSTTENVFTHRQKGSSIFYCSKLPRLRVTQSESRAPITRVDFSWSPEAKHLISTLARIPELNTTALGHKDFHKRHLLRVVFGAVIEPLTVAFDCTNQHLLFNSEIYRIIKLLIDEISMIFTRLPELRNIKDVSTDFGSFNLEKRVFARIRQSKTNVSPMLQRIRKGKKTEVDFFTGYVIERARRLGIACPNNQMMYNLVRGKERMMKRIHDNYIPFE